ncbi:formate/nitrite transporter family protein [Streptomyces sp. NPDC051704]|uniref:formate/nitrite transporter family protein n=1 Tax=Streptomyces sp. NPDC051704 TaxID=3365671 RepID=UPI0037B2E90B
MRSPHPRRGPDAAGILALLPPVAVFPAIGFERPVANAALFSRVVLDGPVGFSDLFRNVMVAVLGNAVGGGLLVGAVYGFSRGARRDRGSIPSV